MEVVGDHLENSTASGWEVVKNKKHAKVQEKIKTRVAWNELSKKHPHIILPDHARKIQHGINVDGLFDAFHKDEWINLQCNGFKYIKTIKNQRSASTPLLNTEDCVYLEIGNSWGDKALFTRVGAVEPTEARPWRRGTDVKTVLKTSPISNQPQSQSCPPQSPPTLQHQPSYQPSFFQRPSTYATTPQTSTSTSQLSIREQVIQMDWD